MTEAMHEAVKKCSWCEEPVLEGQITSKAYDGEIMHFGCAAQADDPNE